MSDNSIHLTLITMNGTHFKDITIPLLLRVLSSCHKNIPSHIFHVIEQQQKAITKNMRAGSRVKRIQGECSTRYY